MGKARRNYNLSQLQNKRSCVEVWHGHGMKGTTLVLGHKGDRDLSYTIIYDFHILFTAISIILFS